MNTAETVIRLADNLELVCPAHPLECIYVQVIKDHKEVGYWDWQEFRDDPKVEHGALLGLLRKEIGP